MLLFGPLKLYIYIHIYEVWSKSYRPDILLVTTLTFRHDTSISRYYWRLLTELHAVLHRLSNIKQTLISRGMCHSDQIQKVKIRAVIKYLYKKGMSPKEFHEDFMGRSLLPIALWKKWAAEFKRDRESIGDDERPGRPKEATNDETAEAVHNVVMCDRRRYLRNIARKALVQFRQFWLISMTCQRFPLDGSPDSWLTTRNGPDVIFQDIFCLDTRINLILSTGR
jgi:hypothetical protein